MKLSSQQLGLEMVNNPNLADCHLEHCKQVDVAPAVSDLLQLTQVPQCTSQHLFIETLNFISKALVIKAGLEGERQLQSPVI